MQFEPGQTYPEIYEEQFRQKLAAIKKQFLGFDLPEIDAYSSPSTHFRMRAEFKIWHENGEAFYAMYQPGEYKKPYRIDSFTIGSATINRLMPALLARVNQSAELKRKLFQVEFLTSTTEESLITLIYHRPLQAAWAEEAKALEADLNTKIIGRSRKQKVLLSKDYIVENFVVAEKTFRYQQVETGFTQPNAAVCQSMLNWAQQTSQSCGGDLLELYCGNGNFTLPLAENFDKVLATEVSKTSVASANYNIALNECDNVEVLRMSSEEFCSAMNKEREFTRLKDIDLDDYNFSTVFVDPPRAGLDSGTEALVAKFDNILYISCNPDTLKANLDTLTKTHTLKAFAFFDQFPYSEHKECGVLLTREF